MDDDLDPSQVKTCARTKRQGKVLCRLSVTRYTLRWMGNRGDMPFCGCLTPDLKAIIEALAEANADRDFDAFEKSRKKP